MGQPQQPTTGIPCRYVRRYLKVYRQAGIDVDSILLQVKAGAEEFESSEQNISFSTFNSIIRLALADSNYDCRIPMMIGREIKLSTHNILGYAMLTSPDILRAWKLLQHHIQMIMPGIQVNLIEGDELITVWYQPLTFEDKDKEILFSIYETLASLNYWNLSNLLQQSLPAYDIYFPFRKSEREGGYDELKTATCHFQPIESSVMRIVFPAELFSRRLPFADVESCQEAEQHYWNSTGHTPSHQKLSTRIRNILLGENTLALSTNQVADRLGLSKHTLERRLSEEGKTIRGVISQLRNERAISLLQQTRTQISEIAYSLGYSNSENFSRAFRRVNGVSPSAFRAADNDKPKSV